MIKSSNKKTHIFLILSITFFLLFYLCLIKPQNFLLLNHFSVNDSYMDFFYKFSSFHIPNDFYSSFYKSFEKIFAIAEDAFIIGGNDFFESLLNFFIYVISIFIPITIKSSFFLLGSLFLIFSILSFNDKKKWIFFSFCLVTFLLALVYFLLDIIVSNMIFYIFSAFISVSIICLLFVIYIYLFNKLSLKHHISLLILSLVALIIPVLIYNLFSMLFYVSLNVDPNQTLYFLSQIPSKLLYFVIFICILISRIIEAFVIIIGIVSIIVLFIDLCKKHLSKKDVIITILAVLFYLTFIILSIILFILPFIGLQTYNLYYVTLEEPLSNVALILFVTGLISFIYIIACLILVLCFSLFILITCTIKYKKKWFIFLYIILYFLFSNILFFLICTMFGTLIFLLFSVI